MTDTSNPFEPPPIPTFPLPPPVPAIPGGSPTDIQYRTELQLLELSNSLDSIELELWKIGETAGESCLGAADCDQVGFIYLYGTARCLSHTFDKLREIDVHAPCRYHVSVDILRPAAIDPRLRLASSISNALGNAAHILTSIRSRGQGTAVTRAQAVAVAKALRELLQAQEDFTQLLRMVGAQS